MDKRYTLKIDRIVEETSDIKTFTFKHDLTAKPGQFIMLTDFEGGEKPFSISECSDEKFSITVKRIGEFTTRLFQKCIGDYVSIRGAYGSSFFISKNKVLLVGGGYAIPTFYFFAKVLLGAGADVTLINGARTKSEHVFADRFHELNIKVINTTDDGSFGEKGTAIEIAKKIISQEKFDFIYASGPEMMMKAMQNALQDQDRVQDQEQGLDYEFLFERYMKCAIGICGNCTMDPLGLRLCVEGPVLPKCKVEQLTEFGKYHRDASGKRHEF
ncbi:MAG: dihydroorotate dehydrogenase electron transfer subunit [Candidatus Cloacimonetes bacterium]|jgi:dihydroorotate dehydrogenase electron transfer subunit|nr:dihydroorotate dehydrogenase electron transfer subunit [Candidatus Cloacimonadota bacterium]